MLKAKGATVYLGGGPDDDDNLLEITKYTNSLNVDMVLDIYCNASANLLLVEHCVSIKRILQMVKNCSSIPR